jgi:hypothetical protein
MLLRWDPFAEIVFEIVRRIRFTVLCQEEEAEDGEVSIAASSGSHKVVQCPLQFQQNPTVPFQVLGAVITLMFESIIVVSLILFAGAAIQEVGKQARVTCRRCRGSESRWTRVE